MVGLSFKESYVSLQREGHLFRSCIGLGMSALAASHAGDVGSYYTAFFQLSIGMERAMKVILIAEYMAANALQRPTTTVLKAHGHKLVDLVAAMRRVAGDSAQHPYASLQSGSIEHDVLEHLSDFATGARYFNLDHSATPTQLDQDPLVRWNGILRRLLNEDVPANRTKRVQVQAAFVADAIRDHASILRFGLDRSLLSADASILEPALTSEAAPYAVLRVLLLVSPLRILLRASSRRVHALDHQIGDGTPSIPEMHEFLDFLLVEKRSALGKGRWL